MDTEIFRLLNRQVLVNSNIISHLADMCLQPVERDAPNEVEAPRADEVPVPVPEVRPVEVAIPAGCGAPMVSIPVTGVSPFGWGHQ